MLPLVPLSISLSESAVKMTMQIINSVKYWMFRAGRIHIASNAPGTRIKPIYSDLFEPHTFTYCTFQWKRSWVCKVSFGPTDGGYMMHVPSFRYFMDSICCVIARTSWNPVLSPDMCWKYASFSTWTDRLFTPASFKMAVTYGSMGTTRSRTDQSCQ